MATRKTTAERIADTKERIEQYEKQMKQLLQRQKKQEQRERTHRLIERGAILESLIPGAVSFTNEQIKLFLEKTIQTGATAAEPGASAPTPQAAPNAAGAAQGAATATAQTGGNSAGKAG